MSTDWRNWLQVLPLGGRVVQLHLEWHLQLDPDTLANRLRHARELAGLTQSQVAEQCSDIMGERITNRTISAYENNTQGRASSVQLRTLLAICEVYSVDINKVLAPEAR